MLLFFQITPLERQNLDSSLFCDFEKCTFSSKLVRDILQNCSVTHITQSERGKVHILGYWIRIACIRRATYTKLELSNYVRQILQQGTAYFHCRPFRCHGNHCRTWDTGQHSVFEEKEPFIDGLRRFSDWIYTETSRWRCLDHTWTI